MASGWSSVMATVLSSGADRPAIDAAFPSANAAAPRMGSSGSARPPWVAGSSARENECTTSRAVSGRPFWKATPARRWKV